MNSLFAKHKTALSGILFLLFLSGVLLLGAWGYPRSAANTTDMVLGVPLQEGEDAADSPPADEGTDGENGEEGEASAEEEEIIVRGLIEVVVARVPIPVGTILREELLTVELRPSDNVAIRAGVTFSDSELLVGQIARANISRRQEILAPMIALSPTDIANFGSDLSLFVNRGNVAVAFPINQYSGVGYTMRPGDFVDVLMSFNMLEMDVEFQTPLPNLTQLVDEDALLAGEQFLFPAVSQGRLEFITEISTIAEITPRGVTTQQTIPGGTETLQSTIVSQEPRRVTQMTIQQAEVLWSGDWEVNVNSLRWFGPRSEQLVERLETLGPEDVAREELFQQRVDNRVVVNPELVILSMPVQDALVMKWAYEQPGVESALVLRAQGDNALYFTTSVSLPQLVEQAGLSIPEPGQFGVNPEIVPGDVPRLQFVPVEATDVQQEPNYDASQ